MTKKSGKKRALKAANAGHQRGQLGVRKKAQGASLRIRRDVKQFRKQIGESSRRR